MPCQNYFEVFGNIFKNFKNVKPTKMKLQNKQNPDLLTIRQSEENIQSKKSTLQLPATFENILARK